MTLMYTSVEEFQAQTISHLNQEPQVDILALWLFPVHLTVLVVSDVDSL